MLNQSQIDQYHQQGFLHVPEMFAPQHLAQLQQDMNWMIETWANREKGWTGPWRKAYMDEQTEEKSELVSMHDLHFYSAAWMHAVTHRPLCDVIAQLVDGPVELHHSTMHVKPPEAGHPFPMHQDWAFYKHADDRYVDVLVHLDDTQHENGEIRFLAGSHKQGALKHITEADGEPCTPHLPTDMYRLEDTVAVPAKAGDVVLFNINTIHGSYINTTDQMRRLVRVGYRHPENQQLEGQSCNRPGLIVNGRRARKAGDQLFDTECMGRAATTTA